MTDYIQWDELLIELTNFLRNADILTIAQRSVATATATGTWSNTSSHIISVTNVRNIRSIAVNAAPLAYGTDYTADFTYNNSGTIACKITLNSAQTGNYTIIYDYGTDRIFTDYPATHLSEESFPRLSIGFGPSPTRDAGLGNILETTIYVNITAYGLNSLDLETYMSNIRKAFIDGWRSIYFLKNRIIRPVGRGATIPYANSKSQKVIMISQDFRSPFNYEKN